MLPAKSFAKRLKTYFLLSGEKLLFIIILFYYYYCLSLVEAQQVLRELNTVFASYYEYYVYFKLVRKTRETTASYANLL